VIARQGTFPQQETPLLLAVQQAGCEWSSRPLRHALLPKLISGEFHTPDVRIIMAHRDAMALWRNGAN
jgi:hypothetical protein